MGGKTENTTLQLSVGSVPVKIVRERRRHFRARVGKDHLILRLPLFLPRSHRREAWQWFVSWAERQAEEHPQTLRHLLPHTYRTGDTLRVGSCLYHLRIEESARKTGAAALKDAVITLKLPDDLNAEQQRRMVRNLLSRTVGQDQLPRIRERVAQLNQLHFRQPVKEVRLKYNRSNWGSCSSKGMINLSTRLLFAPDAIIDYVIVHELAHLVEFNHSPRFWGLVEKVFPDYRSRETWLREHFHDCDF